MPEGTLSFVCPVLNEARFIEAWIHNVVRFADEIHVVDCGSTDGTIEILRSYGIYPTRAEVAGPYQWREGRIRNSLIEISTSDYIVILDADELLPDNFRDVFLKAPKRLFYRLGHLDFWYTPYTIRCRQLKKDYWRRFHPSTQIRVFKNTPQVRYKGDFNHPSLQWMGLGKYSSRGSFAVVPAPFYHYHHVIFGKKGENRANERRESGIKLQTYFGEHPEETRYYSWWGEAMNFPL